MPRNDRMITIHFALAIAAFDDKYAILHRKHMMIITSSINMRTSQKAFPYYATLPFIREAAHMDNGTRGLVVILIYLTYRYLQRMVRREKFM